MNKIKRVYRKFDYFCCKIQLWLNNDVDWKDMDKYMKGIKGWYK